MVTVSPSRHFGMLLEVFLILVVSGGASVVADEPQNVQDRITGFNVVTGAPVVRSAWPYPVGSDTALTTPRGRLSVGSATSPQQGIGPGEPVDMTWDDAQYTVGQGRHIAHSWNGQTGEGTEVDVHFAYRDMQEVTPGQFRSWSGYNVYAPEFGGDWPAGQNDGAQLQALDPQGWGGMPGLDVMGNGRVVMGATSAFWRNRGDGTRLVDNHIYYQMSRFSGVYIVDPLNGNVTWIDSTAYRPHFMNQSQGAYSRHPQVTTQWDGSNTIVHLLLGEDSPGTNLTGDGYCSGIPYYAYVYFRKVGETSGSGAWSAGQVIDSLWFPWASLAAAPYPYQMVAVTYTNASLPGGNLENRHDLDVWLRESQDRGQTWAVAQNITNYRNDLEGDPNHFTAWLESQALYSTDGDLHVVWTAKPTSLNPYSDGFNWNALDASVYYWSKSSNEILSVANGSFDDFIDYMCCPFDMLHCGFGGSNAGYIANVNISQCDDKLYCIWNQIHERANRMSWRSASVQPAPGVLDDCAYTGYRGARANWEIMMSVKRLGADAWDAARNVSNTYTPDCGLPGDLEATGLCGSEYKPSVERYGFDEAGLDLSWPFETTVDLTPEGESSYSGHWYLNMLYLDDEFPGPSMWGEWQTEQRTEDAIKWIRLACVDPVEAPLIAVSPTRLTWPTWVNPAQSSEFTVTIVNQGNVTLNVVAIGTAGAPG